MTWTLMKVQTQISFVIFSPEHTVHKHKHKHTQTHQVLLSKEVQDMLKDQHKKTLNKRL